MTKNLNLPIIDLSEIDNSDTQDEFYKKLRFYARDIGFFYLIGHGINSQDRVNLLNATKKFFDLPLEIKTKIDLENSRHFRGYDKLGSGRTRNRPDFREQIAFGEEHVALENISEEELWLNLIGPNQYPEEIPELKNLALNWIKNVRKVVIKLLRAFLLALEQPENALDDLISGIPHHTLRLVHYPSVLEIDKEIQRLGPHCDDGLLTLLWQDDVGGLQVWSDDKWLDIPYLEDSFVINIGEHLELATDGYLRANLHRVVQNTSGRSRYSIPYFLRSNLDIKQIPLLKLSPELKALSRGISSDPLNPLFREVGKNSLKGRLRSHQEVTKRFYPKQFIELQKHYENNAS